MKFSIFHRYDKLRFDIDTLIHNLPVTLCYIWISYRETWCHYIVIRGDLLKPINAHLRRAMNDSRTSLFLLYQTPPLDSKLKSLVCTKGVIHKGCPHKRERGLPKAGTCDLQTGGAWRKITNASKPVEPCPARADLCRLRKANADVRKSWKTCQIKENLLKNFQ